MSADLQPALQVGMPSGALDAHMLLLFAIMVLAGILGGVANYFLTERHADAGRRDWIKYPVFGVIAALTVPLFLNMISSTLLEGARTKPVDFYVFTGFCLIYVVASRRLFENIAHRLLGQIDQVRHDIGHLKQKGSEPLATPEVEPREVLSYNDVEILRTLAGESFVYGNLAAICEQTGLQRDFVSQRLSILKGLGIIETRINDKNVLHWVVSAKGRAVLDAVVGTQNDKKIA